MWTADTKIFKISAQNHTYLPSFNFLLIISNTIISDLTTNNNNDFRENKGTTKVYLKF